LGSIKNWNILQQCLSKHNVLLITFEGCSNIYSPYFDGFKFVEKIEFLELQIVMHEVVIFLACLWIWKVIAHVSSYLQNFSFQFCLLENHHHANLKHKLLVHSKLPSPSSFRSRVFLPTPEMYHQSYWTFHWHEVSVVVGFFYCLMSPLLHLVHPILAPP
jgi:hypothetical protein